MAKNSRRTAAKVERATTGLEKDVKSARTSKTSARAMRQVADLIREVVAKEKSGGGNSSVFSLERLPKARPRRAGGAARRRRKGG
jgi:hypothetical protein